VYPEATAANYLLKKYENTGQYFFAVDFIDNKTVDYHSRNKNEEPINPRLMTSKEV
jgi:hypothetical protein